jgi:membrane-associated phospholipid phosphatase
LFDKFSAIMKCLIAENMKRLCLPVLILLFSVKVFTQESIDKNTRLPFYRVFYKIDNNFLGSFTTNYGLNYALAAASSYGLVKGGIDWKWYHFSNDHQWVSKAGFVSVSAGGLVPLAVPLGLYFYGRSDNNPDLQITGLALGQAAILGLAISSGIKVFTGRVPPDFPERKNDYSGDFRFGFLRGGAFEGWPSSHTTIAFAMATTLYELYPDNTTIKVCSFAYASLIGLGVSTNIHWFSDAVAGAFIGYAIGKTVGTSFRNLRDNNGKTQAYEFNITPAGVSFTYNF